MGTSLDRHRRHTPQKRENPLNSGFRGLSSGMVGIGDHACQRDVPRILVQSGGMSKYRRAGTTGLSSRSKKRADPFYGTKAWHRFRYKVLERDQWRCTGCGTSVRSGGAHVDHVIARAVAPERELDQTNARTLCHSCHSRKTALVDGAFGNRRQDFDFERGACDADGLPTDPGHHWNAGGQDIDWGV